MIARAVKVAPVDAALKLEDVWHASAAFEQRRVARVEELLEPDRVTV